MHSLTPFPTGSSSLESELRSFFWLTFPDLFSELPGCLCPVINEAKHPTLLPLLTCSVLLFPLPTSDGQTLRRRAHSRQFWMMEKASELWWERWGGDTEVGVNGPTAVCLSSGTKHAKKKKTTQNAFYSGRRDFFGLYSSPKKNWKSNLFQTITSLNIANSNFIGTLNCISCERERKGENLVLTKIIKVTLKNYKAL